MRVISLYPTKLFLYFVCFLPIRGLLQHLPVGSVCLSLFVNSHRPAASNPGMNGSLPESFFPYLDLISAKLTLVVSTWIKTCLEFINGISTSVYFITSGPPNSVTSIAFIYEFPPTTVYIHRLALSKHKKKRALFSYSALRSED